MATSLCFISQQMLLEDHGQYNHIMSYISLSIQIAPGLPDTMVRLVEASLLSSKYRLYTLVSYNIAKINTSNVK